MRWSWMLGALALGGCVTGVVDETTGQPQCGNPLRGSRYAMCARLATAGVDNGYGGSRQLAGSVDSTHPRVSARYTMQGGTFHAYR